MILGHAYFPIDRDIIGSVVRRDIPAIRLELQQIIQSNPTEKARTRPPLRRSEGPLVLCGIGSDEPPLVSERAYGRASQHCSTDCPNPARMTGSGAGSGRSLSPWAD